MVHKFYYIILLLVFGHSMTYSQSSNSNPFEIHERIPKDSSSRKLVIDSLVESKPVTLIQTPHIPLDSVEFLENPFEVSHVPIRKSGYNSNAMKEKQDLKKSEMSNLMIFFLILLSSLFLAIVYGNKSEMISRIVKSMGNENMLKLTKREENSGLTIHHMFLYIIFFINISLFIYLLIKYFDLSDKKGLSMYFMLFIGVLVVYLIRHLCMYLMGVIFPLNKYTSLYNFTILTFNILIGIILLPSNIIMSFAPVEFFLPTVYIVGVVISIILVLRYFRGIFISLNFMTDHLFLFFLYLCSVEIAPILLIWKLISKPMSL